MKHYRIATETGNGFIASQAYGRMGEIAKVRRSDKEAFRMYHNAQRVWNEIYYSLDNAKNTRDFEALKLKNQLSELKVERQNHVILIMGLALFIVVRKNYRSFCNNTTTVPSPEWRATTSTPRG